MQKEQELKAAISNSLNGQTVEGIEIGRLQPVELIAHKPAQYDESNMEKWTEVTIRVSSVRGKRPNESGGYIEKNYSISHATFDIKYSNNNFTVVLKAIMPLQEI